MVPDIMNCKPVRNAKVNHLTPADASFRNTGIKISLIFRNSAYSQSKPKRIDLHIMSMKSTKKRAMGYIMNCLFLAS